MQNEKFGAHLKTVYMGEGVCNVIDRWAANTQDQEKPSSCRSGLIPTPTGLNALLHTESQVYAA